MTLPAYPLMFWVAASAALILVGISKAGFGGGAGVIAMPVMSLTIPVADAAGLLLVLLIVIDLLMLPHYRHHFHTPSLKVLLIGSLVGIVVGTAFFRIFSDNDRILKMLVGGIALAYVALRVSGFSHLPDRFADHLYQPLGLVVGVLAGFASTLIHAGGPPTSVYLLSRRLPQNEYVGTMAILFAIVNLVKLVPYGFLGLLQVGNLATILLLSPLCIVGAQMGIYMNKHFDPVWFNRIVYGLLFLTGLQLIIEENPISLIIALFR